MLADELVHALCESVALVQDRPRGGKGKGGKGSKGGMKGAGKGGDDQPMARAVHAAASGRMPPCDTASVAAVGSDSSLSRLGTMPPARGE